MVIKYVVLKHLLQLFLCGQLGPCVEDVRVAATVATRSVLFLLTALIGNSQEYKCVSSRKGGKEGQVTSVDELCTTHGQSTGIMNRVRIFNTFYYFVV